MKHPPERASLPPEVLSVCCPEAQADGVPCTELGRNCEECERASPARDRFIQDRTDPADPSTI